MSVSRDAMGGLFPLQAIGCPMTSESAGDPTVALYADYVCPFCYLGKQSFERFRTGSGIDVTVDWRPFDLRSHERGPDGGLDTTVDDGKDEAYFDRVREQIQRLRSELGATDMLGIDDVPDVDSLDAQVASHYVQETHPGAWADFDAALYAALWEDGRDIGDRDVLATVGESVGLDGDDVREAVAREDRRAAVFEAFDAAQARGITGVPTFVADGQTVRGAVPPNRLADLVGRVE